MVLGIDFSSSFATTNAMSGMYLWLLFGLLSSHINCDMRRIMSSNKIAMHMISLIAFFFLFTVVDSSNNSNLLTTWVKTVVVYVLFVMTTKSKWYFVIPVLGFLFIDQSLKKHYSFEKAELEKNGKSIDETTEKKYENLIKLINIAMIAVIVVGMLHYMWLQKIQYKDKFSISKFFLGTSTCAAKNPDYSKFMNKK